MESQNPELYDITKDTTRVIIQAGPFEEIGERSITLFATDNNDNTASTQIQIDVYAPIPSISQYASQQVIGSINESLSDEPIRIYRYRGGQLDAVAHDAGLASVATINGEYTYDVSIDGSWLSLKHNNSTIAQVDEVTWKIDILNPVYTTAAYASNHSLNLGVYPGIVVRAANGDDIFTHSISEIPGTKVSIVSDFDEVWDEEGCVCSIYKS